MAQPLDLWVGVAVVRQSGFTPGRPNAKRPIKNKRQSGNLDFFETQKQTQAAKWANFSYPDGPNHLLRSTHQYMPQASVVPSMAPR